MATVIAIRKRILISGVDVTLGMPIVISLRFKDLEILAAGRVWLLYAQLLELAR
jgi:hypothetical protein